MELARVTKLNLNISSPAETLSYTHTGNTPREVMVRIDLGDAGHPIVGNGIYALNVFIDNVLITPASSVIVPVGATKTIMVSRSIPLEPGDLVSIRVTGLAGDTSINTITTLRDVTPLTLVDITGGGSTMVNHDYGGVDNLTYKTALGNGVDNAEIKVYLQADYNAGNITNNYVVGQTKTTVGGKWATPIMLDPANYTLIYSLQGAYGPDLRQLTVT